MNRRIRRQLSGCLLSVLLTSIPLLSQSTVESDSLQTNSTLFRLGLTRFTDSLVNSSTMLKGSSTILTIRGSEEHALIEQAVVAGLLRNSCSVFLDSIATKGVYSLTLNGVELHVRYHEPFQDRIFGESRSQREVSTSVPFTLVERQSGSVLRSETVTESFIDTVAISDVSQLEQQQIPSTIAPLPERSFFDKLLEPLLIIGSTGVAIFLFFHIRS